MPDKEKDLYFVAVKLLLVDQGKLLITHDIFGNWDIPGGRLRKEEFDKPLESVIKRKVREELGADIEYRLGLPKVFFRVERREESTRKKVKIFALGYEAKYKGGSITLGAHHNKMEWVNLSNFEPEKYFTGGWLKGLKEYMSYNRSEL